LGWPDLAQRLQGSLAAFDAAFGRIDHAHLLGPKIKALLAIALVGVVHHQAAPLLQSWA
jgi:hypothetical protein